MWFAVAFIRTFIFLIIIFCDSVLILRAEIHRRRASLAEEIKRKTTILPQAACTPQDGSLEMGALKSCSSQATSAVVQNGAEAGEAGGGGEVAAAAGPSAAAAPHSPEEKARTQAWVDRMMIQNAAAARPLS